jgi:hypothetical protein
MVHRTGAPSSAGPLSRARAWRHGIAAVLLGMAAAALAAAKILSAQSVVTTGTSPRSDQLDVTGSPIGGATSSHFTMPPVVSTTSEGVHDSHAFGHAVSNTATLTVAPVPTVVTGVATDIASTAATLTGTANPNGSSTFAYFQWGTTPAYGLETPVMSMGSGATPLAIGYGTIDWLTCGTMYDFRAVASYSSGTVTGTDAAFTTNPCAPAVTTGLPATFSATGATLNGMADPHGSPTNGWFEYGPTTRYGSSTPMQALGSAGSTFVPIGGAELTCDTVYHFRARASNALGTTTGADQVFSPPCPGTLDAGLLAVVNDKDALRVFDASTLAPVATIPMPVSFDGDVVVTANQSLAFASRQDGIWVLDLTKSPPSLAAGTNPIPLPSAFDLSLTRDGRFLLVAGGTGAPIFVIDTLTRAVVESTDAFGAASVEVCDNGSVLVTDDLTRVIRRLTINSAGMLADTGQQLSLGADVPWNTVCAPRGTVGVVVGSDLQSFMIEGMTPIATQPLPGDGFGDSVTVSPNGTTVFGRREFGPITAYAFNPATGAFGSPLWSTEVGSGGSIFGYDSIAIDPSGRRLFATASSLSSANFVTSLNAATGAIEGDVPASVPAGVALKRAGHAEGDYDGDGRADWSLFRPSTATWYVAESGGAFLIQSFGLATDIPARGDYDGDGKADPAAFRPSDGTWHILTSSSNYTSAMIQAWGLGTDIPVPGDYDGDGKTDFAVFRPSNGTWYILTSSSNYTTYIAQAWGLGTDVPVPGDYDGDGKTDPAVFRPSTGTWYLLQSSTTYTTYIEQAWGLSTDTLVPADYDGDGRTDPAIFRPSTGEWDLLISSSGYTSFLTGSWGVATDVPVLKRP